MKNRKLFMILFYLYITYLFIEMYNSGLVFNVGGFSYLEKVLSCCNFILFKNMGTLYSLFKSFVMYMPIAVLGRYGFVCLENSKHFILFIIMFITVHDLIQVVTLKGYFDVNHIMIGSFGAILAYYLVEAMRKYIPRQTDFKH